MRLGRPGWLGAPGFVPLLFPGLPNRTLHADRLGQALRVDARMGTSTGLLLLDLDRFKQINDTSGHHYGDEVLTQVGRVWPAVVRDADTVARLAGDGFVVLWPDVGSVDVTAVAATLRSALKMPFHVENTELDVEVSAARGQVATALPLTFT
jgi:diguanylate cyclase (GGDEF)-like protein